METTGPARYGLRFGVLAYLSALLLVPVGMIFYRAFEDRPVPFLRCPQGRLRACMAVHTQSGRFLMRP